MAAKIFFTFFQKALDNTEKPGKVGNVDTEFLKEHVGINILRIKQEIDMADDITRVKNTKIKDIIPLLGTLNEDALKELQTFLVGVQSHVSEELAIFGGSDREMKAIDNYNLD